MALWVQRPEPVVDGINILCPAGMHSSPVVAETVVVKNFEAA
jgi:hypothetical protein